MSKGLHLPGGFKPVEVAESRHLYRAPLKGPITEGELRTRTWRLDILDVGGVTAQDDPVWTKRCKEYWELQERLYGLKMSDFTMIVSNDEGVVVTAAVVLDILPGTRTSDWSKVPATRVQ